jgi:hypothetical protein
MELSRFQASSWVNRGRYWSRFNALGRLAQEPFDAYANDQGRNEHPEKTLDKRECEIIRMEACHIHTYYEFRKDEDIQNNHHHPLLAIHIRPLGLAHCTHFASPVKFGGAACTTTSRTAEMLTPKNIGFADIHESQGLSGFLEIDTDFVS